MRMGMKLLLALMLALTLAACKKETVQPPAPTPTPTPPEEPAEPVVQAADPQFTAARTQSFRRGEEDPQARTADELAVPEVQEQLVRSLVDEAG